MLSELRWIDCEDKKVICDGEFSEKCTCIPFIKMDFIANAIHGKTHGRFNFKYIKHMTNLLTVRKASSENVSPVQLVTWHW